MDLKAFTKIYTEAEEAIAEHRFFDTLSLCEAILKDTEYTAVLEEIEQMRADYGRLLQEMPTLSHEARAGQSNEHFRSAIGLLQTARDLWNQEHPETEYAHVSREMMKYEENDLLDQLHSITKAPMFTPAYHAALDAAFVLLWCTTVNPEAVPMMSIALQTSDSFARRTLVGALMLALLERFSTEKLQLLLAIGKHNPADSEADAADMEARVAVALTIVYQRYQVFFNYHTAEAAQLRAFFADPARQHLLPELLLAFTSQSLVERIGVRIDDISSIIAKAFEKQQPHLGPSDEDLQQAKKDGKPIVQFRQVILDESTNERLWDQLSDHARKMDEMRQADLDINYSSFQHLKSFDFFSHSAHWFYPFSTQVPKMQEALTRANGKPDRASLSVMEASRFCANDCYSYACMVGHMRSKGNNIMTDALGEQMEEMEEAMAEFSNEEAETKKRLNIFADYVQCIYRFYHRKERVKDYLYRPFAADARTPIPLLPLFEGLFTGSETFQPCIDNAINLGAHELAIVLIDYVTEHFGTDGNLLYARGYALMQLHQWQRALSAFQQLLLIDEHPQAELCMARCFEAQAQWDRALPYLLREEERCAENNNAEAASIIEETGRCLIELQRWDEAIQRFFRLEFMERHLNVARRAIGWCSIHQGKYERATTYYRQLIDLHKATWEDRLNLGHALWLQGLTAQAIDAYRDSLSVFNHTKKELRQQFRHWTEAFQEDARTLLAAHFDATDCGLMVDAVTN